MILIDACHFVLYFKNVSTNEVEKKVGGKHFQRLQRLMKLSQYFSTSSSKSNTTFKSFAFKFNLNLLFLDASSIFCSFENERKSSTWMSLRYLQRSSLFQRGGISTLLSFVYSKILVFLFNSVYQQIQRRFFFKKHLQGTKENQN